ncbi:MAG: DUF3089 domain-containing protein, partial [Pseudomonadota bacterium]|nr:DUF3089 domain-containing protein [Pseudomonadota bacterium]
MCARRFLLFIFWMIILCVAAAFGIYQFGGRILSTSMTPSGHFAPPPASGRPDYRLESSWLARPGLANDPSSWLPGGVIATTAPRRAAVFYIHPTTYLERGKWNAATDEGGDTASRDALFVRSQASVFADVGEIWA